jgi:hypothetical protein
LGIEYRADSFPPPPTAISSTPGPSSSLVCFPLREKINHKNSANRHKKTSAIPAPIPAFAAVESPPGGAFEGESVGSGSGVEVTRTLPEMVTV